MNFKIQILIKNIKKKKSKNFKNRGVRGVEMEKGISKRIRDIEI